jgi:outer membrane biosynthesis protein TonB
LFSLNSNNFLKHEVDVNPGFDSENSRKERNARLNSLWITVAFHALLVLLFLYIFLKPPFPPLSDSGVFLNLGIEETGMGSVLPEGTAKELQVPSPEASTPYSQKSAEKTVTQDIDENVPAVVNKDDKKKSTQTVKTDQKSASQTKKNNPPVEAPPKPKALYPGSQTTASTSEGTGNTPGDQGQPNGDPRGTDYSGNPGLGGPGKGGTAGSPQLGMSGRKIIYFPPIIDNSQKFGRVVVNIKVDKEGNVVFAKATQKGSTTTDAYLYSLAEQAALKTKVNSDADAAEEQFGTITYTFKPE